MHLFHFTSTLIFSSSSLEFCRLSFLSSSFSSHFFLFLFCFLSSSLHSPNLLSTSTAISSPHSFPKVTFFIFIPVFFLFSFVRILILFFPFLLVFSYFSLWPVAFLGFFTAFVTLSSERILGMWLDNFSCDIQKLNCLLESSLE